VLEAMHAALPIITTCVGGIPELVRDGQEGILIDPANPGAIVEAVIRLSKDSALRVRLAEAARHRAQSLFSIESMVGRTCALYESVLAARAGTPRSG
jgi:glycosyltransferase involved in cell wall biosynthesis